MFINNKNFLKFIYSYICRVYQYITTIYEETFLRISPPSKDFNIYANFKIPLKKSFNIDEKYNLKNYKVNNYLNVKILNKRQKKYLIKKIFTKDFRNKVTQITGFNFSIDFMIFYERKFIPLHEREVSTLNQFYSYRWHFDKPNSSNMLKIFLPINIKSYSGTLHLINKLESKNLKDFREINKARFIEYFIGEGDFIYGFSPTICCHKDGIPERGINANQIMFQLNPSKKWAINSRLFINESFKKNKIGIWTTEPKFPHLSYFFDKRIILI